MVLEQLCLVSSGYVKLIKLHRTADMCRHALTHMSPYKTKYLNKLSISVSWVSWCTVVMQGISTRGRPGEGYVGPPGTFTCKFL